MSSFQWSLSSEWVFVQYLCCVFTCAFAFRVLRPPQKNPRIPFSEVVKMLREAGEEIGDLDDINSAQEIKLGKIVKERYGTDFFFVIRFPTEVRPFYSMVSPDDPR